MEKKSFYLCNKHKVFALVYVMSFLTFITSCSDDDSEGFNSGKERLVTGWSSQVGSPVSIRYDEMKRPTKIGSIAIYYNFKPEDLGYIDDGSYEEIKGKNFYFSGSWSFNLFEISKQGYITNILDDVWLESINGGSERILHVNGDSTTYSYNKAGYLTDIKRYVFDSEHKKRKMVNHCILEWSNGNLVHYYTADGMFETNFGYGNELNKSQIYPIYVDGVDRGFSYDDYHPLMSSSFMEFANAGLLGKVSKNLVKTKAWNNQGYYSSDRSTNSYEYELDESGYVISYIVTNERTNKTSKVFFTYN